LLLIVSYRQLQPGLKCVNKSLYTKLAKKVNRSQQTSAPAPHFDELDQTLVLKSNRYRHLANSFQTASCLILTRWQPQQLRLPTGQNQAHGIKRRRPQNRKYITYRNAVRGGPS